MDWSEGTWKRAWRDMKKRRGHPIALGITAAVGGIVGLWVDPTTSEIAKFIWIDIAGRFALYGLLSGLVFYPVFILKAIKDQRDEARKVLEAAAQVGRQSGLPGTDKIEALLEEAKKDG